jgi:hypothetical protein
VTAVTDQQRRGKADRGERCEAAGAIAEVLNRFVICVVWPSRFLTGGDARQGFNMAKRKPKKSRPAIKRIVRRIRERQQLDKKLLKAVAVALGLECPLPINRWP